MNQNAIPQDGMRGAPGFPKFLEAGRRCPELHPIFHVQQQLRTAPHPIRRERLISGHALILLPWNDCQDLDLFFGSVMENPNVFGTQAVLWTRQAA
ncbi:MAG TPA: hypothetical protein VLZ89_18065 [Anaerolineales bacterium]|nr:hypothetical protein [Anaerolineales bacterium]